VPSSTSSSERTAPTVPSRPVPGGAWARTWLATAALALVAVVGIELAMRARGYRPSVKDDEYAWAWQRARASNGSPHTLAIVGTSRIHLAFAPAAFARALPGWTSVELAIDGTQPAAALVDLAQDPGFRGVVLVDTLESGIAPENLISQRAYVAAYHRRWRAPGAMIERWIATQVEARLAILSDTGVRIAATGGSPPYVATFPDRSQFADYALTDVGRRRRKLVERLAPAPPPTQREADAWLAGALQMEPYIAQIQARGGAVVYLRMPTCDERWAADQQTEPRVLYWDRLAARTRAVAIHFADHPSLRDFECPDTSHIASRDGPRFTAALIDILAARGVVPPAAATAHR
jgi:hypothetical protein